MHKVHTQDDSNKLILSSLESYGFLELFKNSVEYRTSDPKQIRPVSSRTPRKIVTQFNTNFFKQVLFVAYLVLINVTKTSFTYPESIRNQRFRCIYVCSVVRSLSKTTQITYPYMAHLTLREGCLEQIQIVEEFSKDTQPRLRCHILSSAHEQLFKLNYA